MTDSEAFVHELRRFVPAHARLMLCQFRGDPQTPHYGKWRARVLNDTALIDEGANVYLCVSAMQQNRRGEFRRRRENFAGGLCLMIDDVGSGPGSKFPLTTIDALKPTAMVETSPNNFQATYFFDALLEDEETFDALIRAFIAEKFLGADTGQAGTNRVFRPPFGVNGKPKHEGWKVGLAEWSPGNRYSVKQITEAFNLTLQRRVPPPRIEDYDKAAQIEAFMSVYTELKDLGFTRRAEPDVSGWLAISCPWKNHHTGGTDSGAAIRLPAAENRWTGAFRCHHGHCMERGWTNLTEWLAEQHEERLDLINAKSGSFERWREIGKMSCSDKLTNSPRNGSGSSAA